MSEFFRFFQWLLIGAIVVLAQPAQADPIFDSAQWQNRVLVITGPREDPLYLEQMDILETAYAGIEERDLVPVHYKDRSVKKIEGLSPFPFRYNRILRTTREQRYMQQRLGGNIAIVDDDVFSVILIGLDGETKEIWFETVIADDIFAVIDAMPMR